MSLVRVLVSLGGVAGLSLGAVFAQPPATPDKPADKPAEQPAEKPAEKGADKPAEKQAEPAKNISKEAAELLEKAKAASKDLKNLSADVETSIGAPGDTNSFKGSVLVEFKAAMMPIGNWRIELPGAKAGESGQTMAFDGKTVRVINPSAKEMTETPAMNGMGFPEGESGMLLPMWFMDQRSDRMKMMNPVVTEQVIEGEAGATKVGDEKVTVVKQVRQIKIPAMDAGQGERVLVETTRLSLGGDNLPRKTEMTMEMKGGEAGEKQTITQTFGKLKVNTTPAEGVFVLKAPEGYKTRQVTADEGGSPELKVKEGDAALDFALKDADGKEYKLADFKGKVLLIDFWATWCGPCKQAMPALQKLHEEFKDKAVAIVGINTWERGATLGTDYMKKQNYTYLGLLKGDDLAKAYNVTGIPTMLLIDKEGKIAHITVGFDPAEEEQLRKAINEKLK